MSNTINFSDLKRKEVRRVIETGDKEHPIFIYNPNSQQKEYIISLMTKGVNEETKKINIDGKTVMIELIPMLTNISLNLDVEKDKDLIEEIILDPSDMLLEVQDEISDIVDSILNRGIKNLNELSKLPEDVREEVLKQFNKKEKVSEEDKQIIELEEKLKELKNKVGK
jgi:tRNA(Ile)-lysidine synthase TilS/MesJ